MPETPLSNDELREVKETRDTFQSLVDELHKIDYDLFLYLRDKETSWQNNIGTACITVAVALISLLFFKT